MNNTLKVAGRTVTIDIDKLSRGLCDMHNDNEDMKTVLAFGMLDAGLIDMFDKNLKERILSEFSEEAKELFSDRINTFINDVCNEVAKGVYKYANMVV